MQGKTRKQVKRMIGVSQIRSEILEAVGLGKLQWLSGVKLRAILAQLEYWREDVRRPAWAILEAFVFERLQLDKAATRSQAC